MAVASCAPNWSPLSDRRLDGYPQMGMKHQDVAGTFSFEFRGDDSEHIRPPAEAVREEEDVRISLSRGRQGPKVVNADGHSRAVGQGNGEGGPANSLARGFSFLALEAALHPPFGAGFHTYSRVEAFQHFECACDTEVARGIDVACVHDPRSGQARHINADGVMKGGSAPAAVMDIRRRGGGDRFPDE